MHAPLVLRAAARRDAIDDDLALPQRQVALVEQAAAHEALEQALVAGERAEQHQRRHARRHQRIEAGLDLGADRAGRRGQCGELQTWDVSYAIVSIA